MAFIGHKRSNNPRALLHMPAFTLLCFGHSVIPTPLQRSSRSLLLGQRREAQVRLHDAEFGEQRLKIELAPHYEPPPGGGI